MSLSLVLLHPEEHLPDPTHALSAWNADAVPIVLLAATLGIYLFGLVRLKRAARSGRGVRAAHLVSFLLGWLSIALALVSPIDRISEALFSVHMVQHELLIIVAPPLLVFSRPWPVLLMALPARARRSVTGFLARPWPSRGAALLGSGLAAFLLHGGALWVWHVPSLFVAALANPRLHDLQHLSFFLTALLFWSALVHGRYGKYGWGVSVLFVFATALHGGILGALLTLAPRVWYDAYAARTAPWGLTPLEDQQLAGLVMWIPAGILMTLLALGFLGAALGEAARSGKEARRAA